MKITGLLAENGLAALNMPHSSLMCGMPHLWAVIVCGPEIEIWHKTEKGYEMIARAAPDSGGDTQRFIGELSDWLLSMRDQDVLERIVLVAPGDTLKFLRECMPTDLIACLAAEIHKDFSGMDEEQKQASLFRLMSL